MGADRPKQFLEIGRKAILQLTIEKFLAAYPDIKVITVLPSSCMEQWKEYCYEHNFICPQTLVEGGITRFHSVRNALEKLPENAVVAVHDGVRPLLSPELVKKVFEEAEESGAAAPAVPVVDTIKTVDGESVDRSRLLAVQTPQIFHSEILVNAYSLPYRTSFTDDASVVEASGTKVKYIEGERLNIKITTPEDLTLARAIMQQ